MFFQALIHFGEIALKGKNRGFFERALVNNLKKTLEKGFFKSIQLGFGRIILDLPENPDFKALEEGLKNVFGIANFSFALKAVPEIEDIKEKSLVLLEKEDFKTFRITAKRSEKALPFTSQQINEEIGGFIQDKLLKKVKLENPDLTLFIEITNKEAFLFIKKIKGLGGLPVGVSGKAVSLLSGGIDSPVASFLAMKRGLEISLAHFESAPYSTKKSIEKVEELAKRLGQYQKPLKLYLFPFALIQKEILLNCQDQFRIILYRRAMLKIAEKLAFEEKAKALITGDNLGQVASQTIENLNTVEKAVDLPVLRPLICYDKEEIIEKSRALGFFETSILPFNDCCSRFLPKMPEIHSKINEVEKEENKCEKLPELIEKAFKNVKIKKIN
ncbi:MAG: tRNA uracil 4-sulfurtransferase ThiI [bacterium]|nr:tRNA uracil 4-sulfurtransferase ThiI [bacterium]